jgi:hypothetical protein
LEKIKSLVKDLGFPVAVSLVLLYICFSTLRDNTTAIRGLDKTISLLTQQLRSNCPLLKNNQ